MSGTFDTLTAARELEAAGMDRQHAEAVAAIVREGQGELATKDDITTLQWDITTLQWDITTLQWMAGLNLAMTMATLAVILAHAL